MGKQGEEKIIKRRRLKNDIVGKKEYSENLMVREENWCDIQVGNQKISGRQSKI